MDRYNENNANMKTQAHSLHGGLNAVPTAQREQTAAEVMAQRLLEIRGRIIDNNSRMISLGARAFGGTPVGASAGQAGERPEPSGQLDSIGSILSDISDHLNIQQDAITYAERIV